MCLLSLFYYFERRADALFTVPPFGYLYAESNHGTMAGRSFSLLLSALILIAIGAWFIIATILPEFFEVETGYHSVTVDAAFAYIDAKYAVDVRMLRWVFPMIGISAFFAGLSLLGGRGRIRGFIAFIATLAIAVMGLIFLFLMSGIAEGDLHGYWGFFRAAFTSGDIVGSLGYFLEPTLMAVGSVIGLLAVMIGKKE